MSIMYMYHDKQLILIMTEQHPYQYRNSRTTTGIQFYGFGQCKTRADFLLGMSRVYFLFSLSAVIVSAAIINRPNLYLEIFFAAMRGEPCEFMI